MASPHFCRFEVVAGDVLVVNEGVRLVSVGKLLVEGLKSESYPLVALRHVIVLERVTSRLWKVLAGRRIFAVTVETLNSCFTPVDDYVVKDPSLTSQEQT